jgi:hypothetical protein
MQICFESLNLRPFLKEIIAKIDTEKYITQLAKYEGGQTVQGVFLVPEHFSMV